MTQSSHWEFYSLSKQLSLITLIALVASPIAYAQSDEDILEKVRASATKIFLEQASWTLPESFHNSGLAPSDKERLVQQWANTSATCLVNALVGYANSTDVPLSEMVSDDGSFILEGGSRYEYEQLLNPCIERAWEAVGASHEYD